MHNAWFLTTTSTTIQWLYKLIQCDSLLHVSTPAVLGLSLSKTTPSLIHMLSSPISNYKYIIKSCRQIIDPILLNSSQPYPLLSQLSVIHNHITLLPHPFILSSATVVSMDFFHSLACRITRREAHFFHWRRWVCTTIYNTGWHSSMCSPTHSQDLVHPIFS